MNHDEYIKKLRKLQLHYLFNLKELAEYFCVATNTIKKFRQKEPNMHWSTLKNFKDRLDQWEAKREK